MTNNSRFAGCDPGKWRDAFAFVGVEVMRDVIYVRGAKRWIGKDYLDVEQSIIRIHNKTPFDQYIVERNMASSTAEALIRAGLPVRQVFTTKDLKDLKKKASGTLMDKNEMARYMAHWIREEKIVFPTTEKQTVDLKELDRQLRIFAEIKSETGSVSYRAEGQEHDDLVMALMLACFAAKPMMSGMNDYTIHPMRGFDPSKSMRAVG